MGHVRHSLTYGRTFQQTKEKADLNQIQIGIKVEAAGIEPASRDVSKMASTCVVTDLFLN